MFYRALSEMSFKTADMFANNAQNFSRRAAQWDIAMSDNFWQLGALMARMAEGK